MTTPLAEGDGPDRSEPVDAPQPPADRLNVEDLLARGLPRDRAAERRALATIEHRLVGRHVAPLSVSRYVLLRRLGGGGGGVVFAAHDPELDRSVAIKLLAPPRHEDERHRVVREAKALARLSHPNIIAVHDVGTFDAKITRELGLAGGAHGSGVFIVMELVEGVTLTQWLRDGPHSWRDVLRVLIAVGRALAAAHEAGLVHRDVKPDNVLVAHDKGRPLDDAARVRVVDFGLAHFDETSASRVTQSGELPFLEASSSVSDATRPGTTMGTPAYMAPEQHRGVMVDARTDQYGFCVMAYEALFGCRPFGGSTIGELGRAKADGNIRRPPEHGVPRSALAIILRGLAPRPEDRFPSMAALLGRFQRMVDWPRRAAIGTASVGMAAMLSLGAVATFDRGASPCAGQEEHLRGLWDGPRKQSILEGVRSSGRSYGDASWRTVEGIVDAYTESWIRMRQEACRAGVDAPGLERQLSCFDVRLEQVDALAKMLESGDPNAIDRAVRVADALPPLTACARPPSDGSAQDDPERWEVERAIAHARRLAIAAEFERAADVAESAASLAEQHQWWAALVEALLVGADAVGEAGEFHEAERLARRAWVAAERQGDDELVVRALTELIQVVGRKQARYEEADQLVELAQAKLEHRRIEDERVAALAYEVAAIRYDQGRYRESAELNERALRIRQRMLDPDDHRIAVGLNALGLGELARGETIAARDTLERSLEIYRTRLGIDHPHTANVVANLALVDSREGEHDRAIDRLKRVLQTREASLGPDHAGVANTLGQLAEEMMAVEKTEEAARLHGRALATARRALGDEHPSLGIHLTGLGNAAATQGRLDEALAYHRRVLELYGALPPDDPRRGYPNVNLAGVYREQGRFEDARRHAERALALWEGAFPEAHPHVLMTRELLAELLRELGEPERAAALLEEELRTREP